MSSESTTELDRAEGPSAAAAWPWALFVAALVAGIALFFVHVPR